MSLWTLLSSIAARSLFPLSSQSKASQVFKPPTDALHIALVLWKLFIFERLLHIIIFLEMKLNHSIECTATQASFHRTPPCTRRQPIGPKARALTAAGAYATTALAPVLTYWHWY
jgi:hypothetical protein